MCGYASKKTSQWTVHLEVSGCGDLVVCCDYSVAIFEFKIDAPLDSHQSPCAKNGYRQNVTQIFAHIPERQHVVVQNRVCA